MHTYIQDKVDNDIMHTHTDTNTPVISSLSTGEYTKHGFHLNDKKTNVVSLASLHLKFI